MNKEPDAQLSVEVQDGIHTINTAKTLRLREAINEGRKEWTKEENIRLAATALEDTNLEMIKMELVLKYGEIVLIQ